MTIETFQAGNFGDILQLALERNTTDRTDGTDGTNGTDGTDGKDGTDGTDGKNMIDI